MAHFFNSRYKQVFYLQICASLDDSKVIRVGEFCPDGYETRLPAPGGYAGNPDLLTAARSFVSCSEASPPTAGHSPYPARIRWGTPTPAR